MLNRHSAFMGDGKQTFEALRSMACCFLKRRFCSRNSFHGARVLSLMIAADLIISSSSSVLCWACLRLSLPCLPCSKTSPRLAFGACLTSSPLQYSCRWSCLNNLFSSFRSPRETGQHLCWPAWLINHRCGRPQRYRQQSCGDGSAQMHQTCQQLLQHPRWSRLC